jgi:transcriptional regulator with XRE-family HTH domain
MPKHPQTIFGKRLRLAREKANIPQDKLGVAIGIYETCANARISRYETGVHEPPLVIAAHLAKVLNVPLAYFYCQKDNIADLLLALAPLTDEETDRVTARIIRLINRRRMNG